MMASPTKECESAGDTNPSAETKDGISRKLVGVESELEFMQLSDEISSSLLDASLSEYQ
jgi:hypothetical protein